VPARRSAAPPTAHRRSQQGAKNWLVGGHYWGKQARRALSSLLRDMLDVVGPHHFRIRNLTVTYTIPLAAVDLAPSLPAPLPLDGGASMLTMQVYARFSQEPRRLTLLLYSYRRDCIRFLMTGGSIPDAWTTRAWGVYFFRKSGSCIAYLPQPTTRSSETVGDSFVRAHADLVPVRVAIIIEGDITDERRHGPVLGQPIFLILPACTATTGPEGPQFPSSYWSQGPDHQSAPYRIEELVAEDADGDAVELVHAELEAGGVLVRRQVQLREQVGQGLHGHAVDERVARELVQAHGARLVREPRGDVRRLGVKPQVLLEHSPLVVHLGPIIDCQGKSWLRRGLKR
jgi:hypothetical protein